MIITNKIYGYIGLGLFLLIDILLGSFLINIRDDADAYLLLQDPFSSIHLLNTIGLLVILVIIQILFAFYYSFNSIRNEQKFEIYPTINDNVNINWGKFTANEVQEILLSVSKHAGVTISKAYISTEVIPKVFSYNFSKKPVIILNANLLQICSKKELEAAIGVELGFTKSPFTSIITYLNYSASYFLFILYLLPFLYLFHSIILTWLDLAPFIFTLTRVITQLFYVIGLLMITFILWKVHLIFLKLANRNVQYIADKKATKIVGKRNMINMMVKVGQRTEALDLLLEEIKWLESLQVGKVYPFDEKRLIEILPLFPSDELSEEVAQKIAPNIFIKSRLIVLEQTYGLEIPHLDEKIEAAASKLRQRREDFLKDEQEKAKQSGIQKKNVRESTIDWRKADVDGNLDLDEEEIKSFITTLQENKKMLLFENELSGNLLFKGRLPINKRILAVYRTNNSM